MKCFFRDCEFCCKRSILGVEERVVRVGVADGVGVGRVGSVNHGDGLRVKPINKGDWGLSLTASFCSNSDPTKPTTAAFSSLFSPFSKTKAKGWSHRTGTGTEEQSNQKMKMLARHITLHYTMHIFLLKALKKASHLKAITIC